ncbi:MAG TPA: class I SAM-dependent methyltransferase [Bacillota bacterium]|nr:class I SAM-dependent methyltransferase [Bacillota bacterium]
MDTKIDYGNWVPRKGLVAPWIGFAAALILTVVSLTALPAAWPAAILWTVRIVLMLFTLLFLMMGAIMSKAYRLFSYSGGQVSAKILDDLIQRVVWDGNGRALDIGCGSGALSIRVAKKFPDAQVTGVDYWGVEWDYAKEQCERNAQAEGVAERVHFQKGDAAKLDFEQETFDLAVSNFVFHEVKTQPQKRLVVREALRVVKKGSPFIFHDLFYNPIFYGDADDLLREMRTWGLTEVHMERTSQQKFIPAILRIPMFLKDIGIVYGIR